MKHNRICLVFALLLSIAVLSGCMDMKNLTEEESSMVAEYSAGVLLRYSDQYERRLITQEQREKEQTEEGIPTAAPSPMPSAAPSVSAVSVTGTPSESTAEPSEEPSEQMVSLNDLYHLNGLDFSYAGYQLCKKYPKNSDSPIRAEKGQSLLVVTVRVRNTSGTAKKVNLMQRRKIAYQLNMDGSEYQPGISMLENGGLNYLKTTISKGKTENAVLIFRVSDEQKKAASISLTVQEGDKVSEIQLK